MFITIFLFFTASANPPKVKHQQKKQEIKDPVAYLTDFYKKYLKQLKYNVKRGCIFRLTFAGYCLLKTGVWRGRNWGERFCFTDKIR